MITVKCPVRISFVGGGSDVLSNVLRKYGLVVGCSIQQYSYFNIRYLPKFFDYKTRLSYSEIETVKYNWDIKHKVMRAAIKYFDIQEGLEITHISDIPSYSGLGSSSSFLVGLLHGLAELRKIPHSKMDLYNWAVDIEQNVLREVIGLQDSAFAALGGLASIKFRNVDNLEYNPIFLSSDEIEKLQSHILLFYTKIPRVSSNVASKYYHQIINKEEEMDNLLNLAHLSIEAIRRKEYMTVGKFMGESWKIKQSLHPDVSNPIINQLCEKVNECGGYIKVTGAGGGGSLLVFAESNTHEKIRQILGHLVEIPVKIDWEGSKVIFNG